MIGRVHSGPSGDDLAAQLSRAASEDGGRGRGGGQGRTGMTRRVLVVDDDPLLREVAKAALEMVGGWSVLTAGSGLEAQELAASEQPDALLLDVMMPGMDGPSTVLALQADPTTRDIPVVFLTAKMGGQAGDDWADLPVIGVIPKPFDPMTLSAEVARLLGW